MKVYVSHNFIERNSLYLKKSVTKKQGNFLIDVLLLLKYALKIEL